MSIYLRLKRRTQTIFLLCESTDLLSSILTRLSLLMAKDENDVRFYEYMSPQRKETVKQQLFEQQKTEIKASKRKKDETIKLDTISTTNSNEPSLDSIVIPPIDTSKKLSELGLQNDSIIFFVYRIADDSEDFEEIDVPGLEPSKDKEHIKVS